MILDANLIFTPWNNTGDSMTMASTTRIYSSKYIDLTGVGATTAPAMTFGVGATGNTLVAGMDYGIGDGVAIPKIFTVFTSALTGAGYVNIYVLTATDNGTSTPSSWTVAAEFGQVLATVLSTTVNLIMDLPRRRVGQSMPRYISLGWDVTTTTTAGYMEAAIVLNPPENQQIGYYGSGF